MKQMVQKKMEHLVITINDYKFINHINSHFVTQFNALAPASAGGTDRDLAWTQLAQKLGSYNIIEFYIINLNYIMFNNVL